MRRWRRRATTLLELMVTMFMLTFVLLLSAALFHDYSNVLRHSAGKERTIQAAQQGIQMIRGELKESYRVTSSLPGSTLTFLKINPEATGRLPLPPPATPTAWNPHAASDTVTVSYFVSNGNLVRRVEPSGEQTVVASGITGMFCQQMPDGTIQIRLGVQEARRVQTLTTRVYRRVK